MSDSATKLSIKQLQANPFQPRGAIQKEELQDLVDSIKRFGILEPLLIAETPAGYQIIAGERRWRAAEIAGLTEVPVIVKKTDTRGMLEMAIVENVQRVDLSPIERAQAFQQLMRDFGYSSAEVAKKIGKSSPYVSNSLRLLLLPDAVKDALIGEVITEGHARALQSIPDEPDMIECFKIILRENASVRRTEELSRRFREQGSPSFKRNVARDPKLKQRITKDPKEEEWDERVRRFFETNASVKVNRSNRQTRLTITLKGDSEKAERDLEKMMQLIKPN